MVRQNKFLLTLHKGPGGKVFLTLFFKLNFIKMKEIKTVFILKKKLGILQDWQILATQYPTYEEAQTAIGVIGEIGGFYITEKISVIVGA